MLCLEGICLRKWIDGCSSLPLFHPLCRALSSTEVSTALRPFYFSVHPDLFGQFPEERLKKVINGLSVNLSCANPFANLGNPNSKHWLNFLIKLVNEGLHVINQPKEHAFFPLKKKQMKLLSHNPVMSFVTAIKTVNENSLKQLSSYIETVQQNRTVTPLTLKFYLRPDRSSHGMESVKLLKSVNIQLQDRNLRKIVLSILKSCDLPTTYVEQISPNSETKGKKFYFDKELNFRRNESFQEEEFPDNDFIFNFILRSIKTTLKEEGHLKKWLEKNYKKSQEYLQASEPIRNEIQKLKGELREKLELKKIKWDCGWSISHFRGALQSFDALLQHHPEVMTSLKGKTLVFGSETGVNLDGDVMLNCGEVRHNWLDVIKNVHIHDKVLLKLPRFEKAVSRVLRDIKVVHRKFQPKVIAEKYENQLRRLITSLSDHQGRYGYPKHWPEKLSEYELVVETEAGPLMLSPTGQLIVPSSCPAFLVVNFISDNLKEASKLLREYNSSKYVEKDLHARVLLEFGLLSLRKDDNITPSLMIACCNKLMMNKEALSPHLKNSSLFITKYYSLLSDGQMCIPWNWVI